MQREPLPKNNPLTVQICIQYACDFIIAPAKPKADNGILTQDTPAENVIHLFG